MEIENNPISPLNSVSKARYRAKTAYVSPPHQRETVTLGAGYHKTCFLGVSLENRNFQPNRFRALLEWTANRFSKCKILIGDSIHRITLESTQGLSQTSARYHALRIGREFMQENKELLISFRHKMQCEYITCSEIQYSDDYVNFQTAIEEYFISSPKFRVSVESFGRKYHNREWENLSVPERNQRLRRSSEYFLEEFSIFACLVKQGINVMVYPGTFSSLAEIADGKFPGMLPELEALTVVSLMLKRR